MSILDIVDVSARRGAANHIQDSYFSYPAVGKITFKCKQAVKEWDGIVIWYGKFYFWYP